MFKINVMPLKPFSTCLDIRITHITPEVLPVTIFQLTWLISVMERQPPVILDENYGTVYLGQSNSLNHLKVSKIISKIVLC